ncbi:adenylosuccinate lyase [Aquimarina sp. W85]|uniref:adenylosuccinate lyase n=1 Tax=Aquimarina rhodophyticola TaxID=3342246 RepID=UPI00366D091F
MDLFTELNILDHSKEKRKAFCQLLNNKCISVQEILYFAKQVDNPLSNKAFWGLEFICRDSLINLLPHIDEFISILPKVHFNAGVRPAAKICEHLIVEHYKHEKHVELSLKIREAIVTVCFDWLITDQKVAPKAYSMTCLYYLGQEFKWIYPDLKVLLQQDYIAQTAAYRARARHILSKI